MYIENFFKGVSGLIIKMTRRIAIGQSGGPTPVINDTLAGIIYEAQLNGLEIAGLRNGFEGGGLHPEVLMNIVDLTHIDPFFIRGIPGAYLGTTRLKLNPLDSAKGEENIRKILAIEKNLGSLGIDMVFYIGGNDSALTLKSMKRGIHVSKTEDNDLPENDHTPGFGSASKGNSHMVRTLTPDMSGFSPRVFDRGVETYSTAPVVVYQTQGRDTGWLTLGSAFAKINHAGDVIEDASPHLFLARERAYDREELLGKVDEGLRNRGFVFIACSEELVNKDGKKLSEVSKLEEVADEFGHTEHSRSGAFSYADYVASDIIRGIHVKTDVVNGYSRVKETPITPHHIQRTLMRSLIDAQEAFDVGREAVRAYLRGENKVSIGLKRHGGGYDIRPAVIPLDAVAGKIRQVDTKYIGNIEGPSEEFYRDFLPLIGGPLSMTHYVGPRLDPFKR